MPTVLNVKELTVGSLPSRFETLSSTEATGLQLCKSTSFSVTLGRRVPAGVRLIIILYSVLTASFFNKIKNACVAHIVSPQCTEMCVFMQLLTPEITSWEGDKSSECTFL